MRFGHAGVALAAKRFSPRVPMWLLLGAAYGPDALEITFRIFGQYNTEISHSLISIGACATLLAGLYAATTRDYSGSALVWLTYALHWPADFITGHKPTWPGGPTVGLDLYTRPRLVWVVDLAAFALGWWIYRSAGRRDRGTE
jgi:hypothetical protein